MENKKSNSKAENYWKHNKKRNSSSFVDKNGIEGGKKKKNSQKMKEKQKKSKKMSVGLRKR